MIPKSRPGDEWNIYKTLREFRRDQSPPPSIRSILCVFVRGKITTITTTHFVNTTRIPTCINTVITTAVFNIY